MTTKTVDKKYAITIISIIIAALTVNVIVNFNWIDFSYLVFVGSCIIRYFYISKKN